MTCKGRKIVYIYLLAIISSSYTLAAKATPCDIFLNPQLCLGKASGKWLIDIGFSEADKPHNSKYVSEPKENPLGLYIEVDTDQEIIVNIRLVHTVSRYSMNLGDLWDFGAQVGDYCRAEQSTQADGNDILCGDGKTKAKFTRKTIELKAL